MHFETEMRIFRTPRQQPGRTPIRRGGNRFERTTWEVAGRDAVAAGGGGWLGHAVRVMTQYCPRIITIRPDMFRYCSVFGGKARHTREIRESGRENSRISCGRCKVSR